MKNGIIIQARTGSTRLPSKILLPFYQDLSILDIMIANIQKTCPDIPIVLATTIDSKDDILEDIAIKKNIFCYRGSENDVLNRFIGAAEKFGIEKIIRICSDNPFLCSESIEILLREYDLCPSDYVAFSFDDGCPTIKSHLGLYPELTTIESLKSVAQKTSVDLYREHVTIYIYTHPDEFKVRLLPLPKELGKRHDLRFTLDTIDDFNLLRSIYYEYTEKKGYGILPLLQLIENHPEYQNKMKSNIEKNAK